MSATDEICRLLDERGVEWGANDTYRLLVTSWNDASGHSWVFMEHRDGSFSKLTAYHLTPEQAIAATLGVTDATPARQGDAGTCQIETTENWLPAERYHRCKECGAFFAVLDASHDIPPRCCPNCGRKVD